MLQAVFLFLILSSVALAAEFGRVYTVLEEASCRSCHSQDGVAAATRLHFPQAGATPAEVEAFGRSLVTLVNRKNPGDSLLLTKPTARDTHVGGERIKAGSAAETALRSWVEKLAALRGDELAAALKHSPGSGLVAQPANPALRRLTHAQYNNTVRDLLGEQSMPANQFPPEDFVNGFKNQFETQGLSPMLYEAYSGAAEKLARNAFKRPDGNQLLRCQPSPECRAEFVRSFGLRAFRRPLDAAEQKRYVSLMAAAADHRQGAQSVVEAMLQSPHFLFYLDSTPDSALKPYAAASRLAYVLWNTTPDAALLKSAAAGELNTAAGVERTARRMLADPKAKDAFGEFISQWMRFDRVLTAGRDRRLYPNFSRQTAVAMTEETRRFIGDLVWEDRNFMELFTADYGYLNAELAGVYGLKAPEKEFDRVPFPPESERAGLLGQALFLTLTSSPDNTSPTSRGLFVREQFLCQHVPDPPPGVSTDLPPLSDAKPQTNRERLAIHVSDKSCASCHNLVDPIGFGLEKFDAVGSRREKAKLVFYPLDRKSKEAPKIIELPLDTSGSVAGIPNSTFSSSRELGAVLARTLQCHECLVKQYFRYVSGRKETPGDKPLITMVLDKFKKSEFRFRELIVALAVARETPAQTGSR